MCDTQPALPDFRTKPASSVPPASKFHTCLPYQEDSTPNPWGQEKLRLTCTSHLGNFGIIWTPIITDTWHCNLQKKRTKYRIKKTNFTVILKRLFSISDPIENMRDVLTWDILISIRDLKSIRYLFRFRVYYTFVP